MCSTEKIRRAVVTYQLSAKVIKKIGYITKKGKKLVIPDLISIERSTVKPPTDDSSKHRTSLKNIGIDVINEDLEGHYDSALGTFVFNKSLLPKTECEEYRSIAEIEKGLLFKSKLGEFSILRYARENDTMAVTIDRQTKSCGRAMYRTGIPNVQVLLLEAEEEFLDNKHLEVSDMEEEILF